MPYTTQNTRGMLDKYLTAVLFIASGLLLMTSCERKVPIPDLPEVIAPESQDDILVEGIVVDTENEYMPGVHIVVKGTQKGTITDRGGKFKLYAPKGSELDVEFVGYQGTSLKVVGQKRMATRIMISQEKEGTSTAIKPPLVVSLAETPLTVFEPALATPDSIFTVIEKQPEFPGGAQAMYSYFRQYVTYPQRAINAQVEGNVFVRFVVGADGQIRNIQVLKGLGFGLDEEAIRLVSTMPRWKPGSQKGQAQNVQFNLPITFKLGEHLNTNN